jgi:teichuronic acid biosynthesis glycosyltransferase TuaG
MTKISIITPCYNSSDYITRTFDTVRAQTYQDWEWLIVDDCSTDTTLDLVARFTENDPRIKIIRNEFNSGASVSRNKGLDVAAGEFIAFLDADDLWSEKKLEKQIKFMEDKNLDFTIHNYNMINFEGCFLKPMVSPAILTQKTLEMFNPIFTSSVMMRRSTIGSSRFKPELRRRQDYIFWHVIVKKSKQAVNLGESLGSYRIGTKNSLSSNKLQNVPIQWSIYRNEFNLSVAQSTKSIISYAFHGITKYFLCSQIKPDF